MKLKIGVNNKIIIPCYLSGSMKGFNIMFFSQNTVERSITFQFQNWIKKHVFMFILLIGVLGFSQNEPKVNASADTTKIRIGEQINYQLSVDHVDAGVTFPELQLDSLGKIEIVEALHIDTLKNRLVKKYRLTSFDSGRYVIPQQRITVWSQEYVTDSLIIDVATVAVDTLKQKMYPIKAVQNEPYSLEDLKPFIWWIIGILLFIAALLYFIFRKKKTLEEIEAGIPAYDLALKRLKELDTKQLWQQNKIKKYYIELTDIVRSYIERELKIPALESTTNELMETITDFNSSSALNIPEETIIKLQKLLKEADLVKFAKYTPLSNEIELHRNDSDKIVESIHSNIPKEINIEKPLCPITNEEITDSVSIYKWGYHVIFFSFKKVTVGVSSLGKELHLKKQSYFWKIVNAIGNLFIRVPILGGTLILIWLVVSSYLLLFVALVELLFRGKFIDRGMLYLKRGKVEAKSIDNKKIKQEINKIRTDDRYIKQSLLRQKLSKVLIILSFLLPFIVFGSIYIRDTYFKTEKEKEKEALINNIKNIIEEDEAVE